MKLMHSPEYYYDYYYEITNTKVYEVEPDLYFVPILYS